MKKRLLAFFLGMIFLSVQAIAQQKVVTGKVTSAEDGLPLPGVSVKIKGTNAGASTGGNGEYSISATPGQVLVFTYIGTATVERTVGEDNTINVSLKADSKALNEVVVTALGIKQSTRNLAYSVQNINSSTLTSTNQSNILNALKAQATGVQITSAGGAAGAGTRIQIRGVNSLSPSANNQPLFVVDGVPISNETNQFGGSGGDSFQNTNRAADLNPDDIESISILKGTAASVLYGLRAANGAVIITTKSGKTGKPSFSFKSSFSFDDITKTPPIQMDYGNGTGNAIIVDSRNWGPKNVDIPTYNPYESFFKTGHQLQNSFTFSGGNEKATYFTSIYSSDQDGVVPNSKYDKTSIRLSGSLKVSEKWKFDGSANYINSGGTNPRTGVVSGAIFYTMRFPNNYDMNDYLNLDGTQKRYNNNTAIDNPIYFSKNAFLKDNVNRLIGYLGTDFMPNNWLSFNYKLGVDHYTDFRQTYIGTDLVLTNGLGSMNEARISYNEINSNFIAKAVKDFGTNWNLTGLVGHVFTNIKRTNLSTSGSTAVIKGFRDISNYATITSSNTPSEKNNIGVFADVKVSYSNKLFLGVAGRNDWSSTLPENNRSFFYPSASAAYIFTEDVLKNNSILSFGKIRISYAEVGKDADPYQLGTYYSTYANLNSVTGVRRAPVGSNNDIIVGSDDLRPERTKGLEFGGELRFIKDRISLDATYAITNSIDQIVPVPVSYASGYSLYVTNAGRIQNKSLEFLLTANLLNSNGFKIDLNANWSQTKGRVKSMPKGVSEFTFNPETPWVKQIIKTGGRPGDWYGWPMLKVEDRNSPYYGQLIVNGDPTSSQYGLPSVTPVLANNFLIGNAYPDWTGGLGSTLSYKGIGLSFLFNFRKGGDVFDIARRQRYESGIGAETQLRNVQAVFKGVKNIGTATSPNYVPNDIPVVIDQAFYNNLQYRVSSDNNGFQDASWIRLQNVSLSYELPKSLLAKSFIKSASISVTGNNLWVSTPFIGFDPESSTYGASSNAVGYVGTAIPATRSIFMGLNVNF